MKTTSAALAAIFSLGLVSNAQALTIDDMQLTGGSFTFYLDGWLSGGTANFDSGAAIISNGIGVSQAATWDVNAPQSDCLSNVGCFSYAGSMTNLFFHNTSTQIGGNYAAPSGSFEYGGAINVDLSSLFANWAGADFHQGALVSGTVDQQGNFALSWSIGLYDPGYLGQVSWTLRGHVNEVSAVPVPAALWLFGSGLTGLVAVVRRRISA